MHLTAKKEKTIRRIINYVVFMGPAVLLFVVIGLIPFSMKYGIPLQIGTVFMPTISLWD